jgi:hypothetical protein
MDAEQASGEVQSVKPGLPDSRAWAHPTLPHEIQTALDRLHSLTEVQLHYTHFMAISHETYSLLTSIKDGPYQFFLLIPQKEKRHQHHQHFSASYQTLNK